MAHNSTLDGPTFTQEQLDANRKAQRMLHDLFPLFDKAEKCGIPVDALRTIAAGLQQQLQAIHQEFLQDVGKKH